MKRMGTRIAAIVFGLVLCSSFAAAAPGGGGSPGIIAALDAILAELEVISSQLASGGQDGGVDNPALAEGLVSPPAMGDNVLVSISGSGKFLSARLSKQGGASGLTEVVLRIDGEEVVRRNIVALKNLGLTADNPYGIVVLTSAAGIDTVTIGFQEPLNFQSSLTLSANVGETGVVQITAAVVYGE